VYLARSFAASFGLSGATAGEVERLGGVPRPNTFFRRLRNPFRLDSLAVCGAPWSAISMREGTSLRYGRPRGLSDAQQAQIDLQLTPECRGMPSRASTSQESHFLSPLHSPTHVRSRLVQPKLTSAVRTPSGLPCWRDHPHHLERHAAH
jgi:hypothetical protein